MDESYFEERINELSDKINSLILGYKFAALALLFLFSLLNMSATLSISKFRQIFQDALGPDHPLPLLTSFFLEFQTLVTCLVFLWPTLGILAVFRFRKISHTTIAITCLLMVVIAQLALTWFSLFAPMTSLVEGMSDQR